MRRAAVLLALVVLLALAGGLLSGCELVADFDRSKIPTPDAGPSSDGGEMPIDDAAVVDAGGDDEDGG